MNIPEISLAHRRFEDVVIRLASKLNPVHENNFTTELISVKEVTAIVTKSMIKSKYAAIIAPIFLRAFEDYTKELRAVFGHHHHEKNSLAGAFRNG